MKPKMTKKQERVLIDKIEKYVAENLDKLCLTKHIKDDTASFIKIKL